MADAMAVMNWLVPILYLALVLDYSATFFLQRRTSGWSAWLPAVVVVHAALVGLRAAETGHVPPTNEQEVLSVVALTTAAVYTLVELASRDRRTGLFVLLLVFLFQYTSSMLLAGAGGAGAASGVPAVAEHSLRSGLHVTAALVTYTALGFAAVYGALHLAAQRDLRRRRFGVLFDRLPPVERLGRMSGHALLVGFLFLTATIAAAPLSHGAAMTSKITSKIIAGSAAWGIYAAAILGRWIGRWPATRISAIAILGFVVVMILMGASGLLS